MKKTIALIVMLFLIGTALTACNSNNIASNNDNAHFKDSEIVDNKTMVLSMNYYLDSYTNQVFSGCKEACDELGYTAKYVALNTSHYVSDSIAELEYSKDEVTAVCVKRTSETPSLEMLKKIADSKTLVSMDGGAADLNVLSIQPADPAIIGDALLQSAVDVCEAEGEIIILTRADKDATEAEYVESIFHSYYSNQNKYKHIDIADTYYSEYSISGFNEAAKNILKEHPDCKCIIALSPVALLQAAKVVFENECKTKVTGLGMPSEMELYILNGIVQKAYLWNPTDYGYLISRTMDAVNTGHIQGKTGESFKAGRLGNIVIEKGPNDENRIVLGLPMKFDINNISIWSKVF